jgi:hypothetical protein
MKQEGTCLAAVNSSHMLGLSRGNEIIARPAGGTGTNVSAISKTVE